jgi:hypothetical protein
MQQRCRQSRGGGRLVGTASNLRYDQAWIISSRLALFLGSPEFFQLMIPD